MTKTKEKKSRQKRTRTRFSTIFESFHDSTKRKEATDYLTYENADVPISVSIGDTLEREPTHICDPDAKELIRKFMEELKRRGKKHPSFSKAGVHARRHASIHTQASQCTDGMVRSGSGAWF